MTGPVDSAAEDAPARSSHGTPAAGALEPIWLPAPFPPGGEEELSRARRAARARARASARRWRMVLSVGLGLVALALLAWLLAELLIEDATTVDEAGAAVPVILDRGPAQVLGRPAEVAEWQGSAARASRFSIPALEVATTLVDGIDPGPGPVLWPGTPWPGGEGRSVVALWSDLSTMRPGHEVLVGNGRWLVASVTQVATTDWPRVADQPEGRTELALVEAGQFSDRSTRTLVVAWPAPEVTP